MDFDIPAVETLNQKHHKNISGNRNKMVNWLSYSPSFELGIDEKVSSLHLSKSYYSCTLDNKIIRFYYVFSSMSFYEMILTLSQEIPFKCYRGSYRYLERIIFIPSVSCNCGSFVYFFSWDTESESYFIAMSFMHRVQSDKQLTWGHIYNINKAEFCMFIDEHYWSIQT